MPDVDLRDLRSFARYDPKLAAPRTWLLRIARNAVTDHLRSLRRRGALHVTLDRVPDLVAEVPDQDLQVKLDNCSEPGSQQPSTPDMLKIMTRPNQVYMNGGSLAGGDIQVEKAQ